MSEQTQLFYSTEVICGVVTPKGNVKIDKAPLQSLCLRKKWRKKPRKKQIKTRQKQKTGVTWEVVTPQRQDHVWSSPLAMFLLQLRSAGFLSLKIEWTNSISIKNWGYLWWCHTHRLSKLSKPPCIKTTTKKKTQISFSQTRAHMMLCYWGHQL